MLENYEIIYGGESEVNAFIWKIEQNGAMNIRKEYGSKFGKDYCKVIYEYSRED